MNRDLCLVFGIALAFRLPFIDAPIFHDETYSSSLFLCRAPGWTGLGALDMPSAGCDSWAENWRRQLPIHPPLLSYIYFIWIRLFGDSEISLHLPSLAAGLIGIYYCYRAGLALGSRAVGLGASLLMALSPAHSGYSVQAVHAPFEAAVFAGSLYYLAIWERGSRAAGPKLLAWNAVGLLLFYHYLVFMAGELYFAIRRWRGKAPHAIACAAACAICLAAACFLICGREYYFEHWQAVSVMRVARWIAGLPLYTFHY